MYFTIPGKPQGKARARTVFNKNMGRVMSYTPTNTVNYENLIKTCYINTSNKGWFNKEPLKMNITAYFSIPKSTSKKDRERILKGEITPTKKPDADNIAKVICDALNGIAYTDDTQIIVLNVEKKYTSANPLVSISIEEIML